jgi:hypothetical protein
MLLTYFLQEKHNFINNFFCEGTENKSEDKITTRLLTVLCVPDHIPN